MPEPEVKRQIKLLYKPKIGTGWCIPFIDPYADLAAVQRTQRYFYENDKKRPVQFKVYYQLP